MNTKMLTVDSIRFIGKFITNQLHKHNWCDIWYACPSPSGIDTPDRWCVGVWTGPQNDLICVKHCKTNEEAEKWLSPGGNDIFEAIEKSEKLLEEYNDNQRT